MLASLPLCHVNDTFEHDGVTVKITYLLDGEGSDGGELLLGVDFVRIGAGRKDKRIGGRGCRFEHAWFVEEGDGGRVWCGAGGC